MRTDNRNVKNSIVSIYFLLLVLAVLLATVFRSYEVFSKVSIYLFLGLLVIFVFVYFMAKYFEYDSDGVKIVITNRGLIVGDLINYRQKQVEFAKRKLVSYRVRSYVIYKSLIITLRHSDGKTHDTHFNVTLLKQKKLKYVKQSLKRIIKENIKHKPGE